MKARGRRPHKKLADMTRASDRNSNLHTTKVCALMILAVHLLGTVGVRQRLKLKEKMATVWWFFNEQMDLDLPFSYLQS